MRRLSPRFCMMPFFIMAASMPVMSAASSSIDLAQLCTGSGDCVVTTNTTIRSASAPLTVGGNFTVNPGVVLVYEVPVHLQVIGNMVLSGTLGAPGDGGLGGDGGGGAGGAAPAVVNGVFDVKGSITLNANAAAAAEGGAGGAGGAPSGVGGAGGAAGSLTFNTCSSFTSASGAQVLAKGGAGGDGDSGAAGGAGGNGGIIIINALQTIVSNATMNVLGGIGGDASGTNGVDGNIGLTASSSITVGANTLTPSANATINQNQSSIAALSFCTTPGSWANGSGAGAASIPTLSEWAMLFLSSLMAVFAIRRMRRR